MKVVVLGGTIFVGRAVVEALHGAGHDVVVVHRGQHEPGDGFPDVEHLHASSAALPPLDCDVFVDCRAAAGDDVERVLRSVPDVPTVMLSSVDVYPSLRALQRGTLDCDVPIDEDTPVRTTRYPYRGVIEGMDDYEKLDCEPQYLERRGVVLRLPFVVGPHDQQRREENVLRRIRRGDARMEIGSGNVIVSRVFAPDVGTAVVAVLERQVEREVYVLGEHPAATARQLFEEIIRAAGSTMELVTVADESTLPDDVLLTKTHQQHLLVSPAKAMRDLDWRPTPWRDAVRASVEWHLAHPPSGGGA
jgi:nucleoside-diphosphate-sugar epimerase